MKKQNMEITDELLVCYLEGKATKEELAAIEAYLKEHDDAVDTLLLARYELGYRKVKRRFYGMGVAVLVAVACVAFALWRLLTPLQMKVNVVEDKVAFIPALPFEKGALHCEYADNALQTIRIDAENKTVFLNDIPYHLNGSEVHLVFEADGYERIDTMVRAQKSVELCIKRNGDLGTVFGRVVSLETGEPVEGATVTLLNYSTTTDTSGQFRIEIPFEKQDKVQRVLVTKEGYQPWDELYRPSATDPWIICLTQ